MTHHTTDPAKRAAHIPDRLEREHDRELIDRGENHLRDWPSWWIQTYCNVLAELTWIPFAETNP